MHRRPATSPLGPGAASPSTQQSPQRSLPSRQGQTRRKPATQSHGPNAASPEAATVARLPKDDGAGPASENQILKAAQAWAQQTNVNFAVLGDSGAAIGGGLYQQGDPSMADIRIGGYNFGNSALAQAYMPPPVNNTSYAGDVQFNTCKS